MHTCSHITAMATINESFYYITRMFSYTKNEQPYKVLAPFLLKRLVCPPHFNAIALQNERGVIRILRMQVLLGNITGNSWSLSGLEHASSETLYEEICLYYQGWLLRFSSPWPFNCVRFLSKPTQLEQSFCLILGSINTSPTTNQGKS